MVRGTAKYGAATALLTATVVRQDNGQPVPQGGSVTFYLSGAIVGKTTTDAGGVATLTVALPFGTMAANYPKAVRAEYAGTVGFMSSAGTGPLRVARARLMVKPVDQTVGLRQPNPASGTLELADGSSFVGDDTWDDLDLTRLRFLYSRNYPHSNPSERVGKTYRISAAGVSSPNYDIRYQSGVLTVV